MSPMSLDIQSDKLATNLLNIMRLETTNILIHPSAIYELRSRRGDTRVKSLQYGALVQAKTRY